MIDQETLQVELGERTYPIIIGSEFFKNGFIFDEWVSGKDCLIVTNEVVAPLYLESLVSQLKNKNVVSLILPDGESNKTLTIWSQIIDKLVAMKASRDTTVIALGGGVIGDITDLQLLLICEGYRISKCLQHYYLRWILPLVARPVSIIFKEKI